MSYIETIENTVIDIRLPVGLREKDCNKEIYSFSAEKWYHFRSIVWPFTDYARQIKGLS